VGSNPIGHPTSLQRRPSPGRWILPPLGAEARAGDAFSANVAAGVAHVRANVRGAVLGRNPEFLHQVRIGIRRLRSTLRAFRGLVSRRRAVRLERQLRSFQRALGTARDWDEFAGAGFAPVLHRSARRQRAGARRMARAILAGVSFSEILRDVLAWSRSEPWRAESDPDESLAAFGARAMQRLYRSLCREAKEVDWADAGRRHRVRIRLKRLRYGCACFAAGYRPEASKRFLHRLRRLQELLGELNDIQVQRRLLGELGSDAGVAPAAQAARQVLDARERRLIRRGGKVWSKFEAVRPYWQRRAARVEG
jgi:triphosphatase